MTAAERAELERGARAATSTQAYALRCRIVLACAIEALESETLRAYATALGGHVDITVSVGPHSIKVA
ncbi:hypothetical protein [Actinomadura nitritigenes]|uniref:hypothetical protein n=1 Tax=Actinomadura nitritigenes TaxID=134602 RepID=UPI003D9311BE